MRAVRLWSVRHSRFLETAYDAFSSLLGILSPLLRLVPRRAMEYPVAAIERAAKGLVFDCHMCGQCVLSRTGMACPMNCPKNLRNGPCGGVRANGNCEVEPNMPCVWVQAWSGSQRMRDNDAIMNVQKPVDQSLRETSSWLRVTAQAAADRGVSMEKSA